MSNSGRTAKSMMNVLTGVFGQFFSFVLSFIIRTVFIHTLGEVYLGLNGLYSNILSVLNLTELGLGTAIVLELYKTVAKNDEEKSKQYLEFYRKAYYCIGFVILIVGLALTPFLDHFVNDSESLNLINYRLVFLLYLFNTVFSYFFFAYRNSILQANQQEYKTRIITYIFKFVEMILQLITLLLFKNIYVYLIIPLALGCIGTVVKGVLIGKWFPFILTKPKGKLSKTELKETSRNVFSVCLYKISGIVMNSTDNILISSFISIVLTGIYSNYLILTSAISTLLEKVFSAFTASLGNLNAEAEDDYKKKYEIFSTLSFLNFWAYGFCGVCLYVLFHPFIKLWIGERFWLNDLTEFIIVCKFVLTGLQETIGTHRAAYGLFYRGRYRPIFSVLANIVLSIALVLAFPAEYGVVAIILGTILSNLFVSWWYDALILHKYAFHMSPKKYYIEFWFRFIFIMGLACSIKWICSLFSINPIVDCILYGLICTLVYNVLFVLLFGKRSEFKYLVNSAMNLLNGVVKKRRR